MATRDKEKRFAKILMQECLDSKNDPFLKYVIIKDYNLMPYDYVKLRNILLENNYNMYNLADAPKHFLVIEEGNYDHKFIVYKMIEEEIYAVDARRKIFEEGETEILLHRGLRFHYCMIDLWYMLQRYGLKLIEPQCPDMYYRIRKSDELQKISS